MNANTRLNTRLRAKIKMAILKHIFSEKESELKAEEEKLTYAILESFWTFLLPNKNEIPKKDMDNLFAKENRISFKARTKVFTSYMPTDEFIPECCETYGSTEAVEVPSRMVANTFIDTKQQQERVQDDKRSVSKYIDSVLNAATTVSAAIAHIPQFEEVIAQALQKNQKDDSTPTDVIDVIKKYSKETLNNTKQGSEQ